jgi:hypothetical protein
MRRKFSTDRDRVINTDEHTGYPPAIVRLKSEGALVENCGHRPLQYLNNVLEQDHRAIKRRVRVSQHFRSFWGGLAYDRRLRGDLYDPQRPSAALKRAVVGVRIGIGLIRLRTSTKS